MRKLRDIIAEADGELPMTSAARIPSAARWLGQTEARAEERDTIHDALQWARGEVHGFRYQKQTMRILEVLEARLRPYCGPSLRAEAKEIADWDYVS